MKNNSVLGPTYKSPPLDVNELVDEQLIAEEDPQETVSDERFIVLVMIDEYEKSLADVENEFNELNAAATVHQQALKEIAEKAQGVVQRRNLFRQSVDLLNRVLSNFDLAKESDNPEIKL